MPDPLPRVVADRWRKPPEPRDTRDFITAIAHSCPAKNVGTAGITSRTRPGRGRARTRVSRTITAAMRIPAPAAAITARLTRTAAAEVVNHAPRRVVGPAYRTCPASAIPPPKVLASGWIGTPARARTVRRRLVLGHGPSPFTGCQRPVRWARSSSRSPSCITLADDAVAGVVQHGLFSPQFDEEAMWLRCCCVFGVCDGRWWVWSGPSRCC
jgi:hypothetical protein